MKKLRTRFFLCIVAFSAVALFLMGAVILNRRLSIGDVAIARAQDKDADAGYEVVRLSLDSAASRTDVVIPLPADAHQEDASFERHYLTRELVVDIRTEDANFYENTSIPCNVSKVENVRASSSDYGVRLTFAMNALYEPTPEIGDSQIRILLVPPDEKYDKIIVVDPAYARAGSDAALYLATRLREIAAQRDDGARIYLTRTGAENADLDSVLALCDDAKATRYLKLLVASGEEEPASTTYFNDLFFIRNYGNAAFARDVETALQGLTITRGVETDSEDEALTGVKIPAALLRLDGVRGVAGDSETLLNEIADALYDRILSGYDATQSF